MSDMQNQPSGQQGGTGAEGSAPGAPPTGTGAGQPGAAATGTATTTTGSGRGYVPRQSQRYADDYAAAADGPSGAAIGGTVLAAVLMVIAGLFGFFEGLSAIVRSRFYVVLPNYAFSLSAVGWGWIHLIIGVVMVAAGLALFADQTWARAVGVALAAFSMIANFVYLPYYPVWAIVLIGLDAFVIWALLSPRYR